MSRGLRNNNPGNIRISGTTYKGEVVPTQDRSFKQFENMVYGYRAMFMLLYTYQKKHGLNTIRQMIDRYAPPVENHTDNYVDAVAKSAGIGATARITTTNRDVMVPIVAAMSQVENGVEAVMTDINAGWELFIQSLP